jgi:hypothetical protein
MNEDTPEVTSATIENVSQLLAAYQGMIVLEHLTPEQRAYFSLDAPKD